MPLSRFTGDLENRLRVIARHRTELDVTQLQVINLDEVREACGPRWSELRARIFDTSVSFLQKRITPEDLLIPCGNGFIVVFGSLEGAAAEIAGLQLARSLNQFFLGEEWLQRLRLQCKHQTLEIAGITNLVRALEIAEASGPVNGTLEQDGAVQEITFKFQPFFDVKHEVIATWAPVPFDAAGHSLRIDEHEAASPGTRRGALMRDRAMIEASVKALKKLLERGEQGIIDMTLHASILADLAHRQEILEALSLIDPALKRYLLVTLGDIVHGFPRFHLDEILRLIAQKMERVSLLVSFDEPDFESLATVRASAMGYRVPRLFAARGAEAGDALRAHLLRDARRAHKHAKRFIVDLDGPAESVHAARAAEADFIGSLALWPFAAAPRGIERFELPSPAAA